MALQTGNPHATVQDLLAEIDRLRAQVVALSATTADPQVPDVEPLDQSQRSTSRRGAFRVAGGATAAAVVGTLASARPAAANDPNDVVKNVVNATTATTELSGSLNGPILRLENNSTSISSRGLYASSGAQDVAAVRGDNSNSTGIGGVGVSGYAPGGRDLFAFGSGRIAMNPHTFSTATNSYLAGEIHHVSGNLYTMVSPTVRRKLAGPTTAGALHMITPVRAYDSRQAAPAPGQLAGGTTRIVSVADGRGAGGAVTAPNAVPAGATAVLISVTVLDASKSGALSVDLAGANVFPTTFVSWTNPKLRRTARRSNPRAAATNSGVVRVNPTRQIAIRHDGSSGRAHVTVDVLGYYL